MPVCSFLYTLSVTVASIVTVTTLNRYVSVLSELFSALSYIRQHFLEIIAEPSNINFLHTTTTVRFLSALCAKVQKC